MTSWLRALLGSTLEFFRTRVTPEDFAGDSVRKVVACGEGMEAVARRLFPAAEVMESARFSTLRALRHARVDAAVIEMRGGETGPRLRVLFSGARHLILVPAPDYVYRLGLGRGPWAFAWAVLDRFLVAPLALLWLGVLSLLMAGSGLMRKAGVAQELAMRNPLRVLVIRLVPTSVLVTMLRHLRNQWPTAHLAVVLASSEGAEEVARAADEIVSLEGVGARGAVRVLRAFRADVALLAGGADYGLRPPYLKALLLTALTGARVRYHWEPGEVTPGRPLQAEAGRLLRASRVGSRKTHRSPLGLLTLAGRRRAYYGRPKRGPELVQIGLSEACNYQCVMCAFHNPVVDRGHTEADMARMSFETYSRLLYDLRRLGTKALDICGNGEPLTNPQAIEMLALARELGFEVTLATNAGLLTESRARALVDMGLLRMHVSVNAGSDETYAKVHPGTAPGTMGKIIARLRAMQDYAIETGQRPIDVEFSAVLTRLNRHEIVAMVEAARAARASWLMLICMGPVRDCDHLLPLPEDWEAIRADLARAKALAEEYGIQNNLTELEPVATEAGTRCIYEEIPCYIGSDFALVFASGFVNFCCHCYTFAGRITEQSFAEIWRSDAYQKLRDEAMALPKTRKSLEDCGCFHACSHVSHNVGVHERLYGTRWRRNL